MKLLEVENLSITFKQKTGDVQAVRGVSLSIENQGESLGIVGESGSGKSVSSLAVMQLIKEPPGIVRADKLNFNGVDILGLNAKQKQQIRGSEISMIFQEPMTSLDPVFTIEDQIVEAIRLHQSVSKKDAVEVAVDILDKVQIENPRNVLGCYPHQLSGGMRQRVMIAIALSCRPKILIADEPTTALDVTVQAQVLQVIKDLQQDIGMSLMMITHDLGVIAETVDNVVVMYGGRVLEYGSVFDIFENPSQPYTEALLKSIPDVSKRKGGKLYSIEGSSPNPVAPPPGCPFHPRCPVAQDICSRSFPERTDISENHYAHCWRLTGYE